MPADITGRDGFIVRQALATAYALIGTLPERCQEESNRHDMARLLRADMGEDWAEQAQNVRHVLSESEWLGSRADRIPLAPDALADDRVLRLVPKE